MSLGGILVLFASEVWFISLCKFNISKILVKELFTILISKTPLMPFVIHLVIKSNICIVIFIV